MKASPQVYVKNSLEAAELYKNALNLTPDPEMTGYNEDGTYEHVSLMFGDTEVVAVAEDSLDLHDDKLAQNKRPVMSFNVSQLGTREAVDHAFAVLSKEARINDNPNGPESPFWDDDGVVYGFSLLDKFGVHWWICT